LECGVNIENKFILSIYDFKIYKFPISRCSFDRVGAGRIFRLEGIF